MIHRRSGSRRKSLIRRSELDAGAGPLHLLIGKAAGPDGVGVPHVGVRASLGIQHPSDQALSLDAFANALGVRIDSGRPLNANCGPFTIQMASR